MISRVVSHSWIEGRGKRLVLGVCLAAVGLAMLAGAFYLYLPVGFDFYHWYWPVPRAWLAGETRLYDEASRGFYVPPWAVWLLLPFSLVDIRLGMAALTLTSLAIAFYVAHAYLRESAIERTLWPVLLAVLCPYSLQVFFVGTPDAFSLLGVFLGYRGVRRRNPWLLGLGLALASVRPQNAFLTGPALLLGMREGGWKAVVQALLVPGLVVLASLPAFGFDWPLRWWESLRAAPPIQYLVTSTYDATSLLGLPYALVALAAGGLAVWTLRRTWLEGLSPKTLDATVAGNAIVSPYMLSQSYLVLLALPWARLAARRPLLAVVPYVMSLPLLLRAQGLWDRLGLLDVAFPLVLLACLLIAERQEGRGEKPSSGSPPHTHVRNAP